MVRYMQRTQLSSAQAKHAGMALILTWTGLKDMARHVMHSDNSFDCNAKNAEHVTHKGP